MRDRIDIQMLNLAVELSNELEEYVNRDYEENYQQMLCTRAEIGSLITNK